MKGRQCYGKGGRVIRESVCSGHTARALGVGAETSSATIEDIIAKTSLADVHLDAKLFMLSLQRTKH